ncbi:uncharacterized protein si:dkey-19b23.7 [Clupea harengus]|uniref:Uncharacterized protein si:dkey-19b23.7 n=1 Tax=Clupea harengus TaxID=7950 RepID=A0A6P8GQD4_CLUHA|nr:uncharacterized protein si:dkey-19b23.7 [Clupea harengus]
MTSSCKRDNEQRRRLQHFQSDLANLGSLQGFQYFQPWLRGREELLLTIVNEDQGWQSPGFPVSAASSSLSSASSSSYSFGSGYDSSPLPGEKPPLAARPRQQQTQAKQQQQQQQQQQASRSSESHLLPASPSEREIAVPEMNCTLFLLAGYAKYGRPYAWIRSNHERLVNIGGTDSLVKDTPMKLKSVSDWSSQDVRVWDVVSELVGLCTMPPPDNPFSLDTRYLQSVPLPDRFLITGALLNFLEGLVVQGNQEEVYYDMVVQEMKWLRRLHVHSLSDVLQLRGNVKRSPPAYEDSAEEM